VYVYVGVEEFKKLDSTYNYDKEKKETLLKIIKVLYLYIPQWMENRQYGTNSETY
jgi:hypothetical protein